MFRLDWDVYWLLMTKIVASRSTCLSKNYGAVLTKDNQIISTGYNGNLPGEIHCIERGGCLKRMKGEKGGEFNHCVSSHAETNAILLACKKGISTEGSTLYIPVTPCYTCVKNIIMAGIKRVVYGAYYKNSNYNEIITILNSNGVETQYIDISQSEIDILKYFIDLDFEHNLI